MSIGVDLARDSGGDGVVCSHAWQSQGWLRRTGTAWREAIRVIVFGHHFDLFIEHLP